MAPMIFPDSLRRRARPPWVATLTLLLLAPCVEAHLPEYFGRKFVLVGEPTRKEADNPCRPGADSRREAEALNQLLEERQRAQGAYAVTLADPMGELGELYAAQCNHTAALDAHRRAVQLLRINEGLLTKSQIPYLKAMAASSQAIGDFESAQLTLRYVFRIHGMGRGDLTPQAVEDALAYFQRARDIFIDPRSPADLDLFFQAYEDNLTMYEVQVEDPETNTPLAYEQRRAIALSHLYNLYLILGTDLNIYGSGAGDAGVARWDLLQRMQQLTYGKGMDVLEGLLLDPAAAHPDERAELLLQRGNWQQWNDKWQSACASLEEAWHAAGGAGDASLRARLAAPAELPEDPALWVYLQGLEIPALAEVSAGFRVSSRGVVSRVEGGVVGEGSSGLAGRVLRWLRDSHMRPAVRDGACVDAQLEGRHYRLVD
jgi:hypothetical protein